METLKKFLEDSGVEYEICEKNGWITCCTDTRVELTIFERNIEDMNYDLLNQVLKKVEKWQKVADREGLLVFNSAKGKYATSYDRIVFNGRHLEVCDLDKEGVASICYENYLQPKRYDCEIDPEVVNHEFTFDELFRFKELAERTRRKAVIEKNNSVYVDCLSDEDSFAAFKYAFPELLRNLTTDDVQFSFDGDWEYPIYLVEVSGHLLIMTFAEAVTNFELYHDQTLETYESMDRSAKLSEEKKIPWGFVKKSILKSRKAHGMLME